MIRSLSYVLLPLAFAGTFASIARAEFWACPADDPTTPEFETIQVECGEYIQFDKEIFGGGTTVPAVDCEDPDAVPPAEDTLATQRYQCCCNGGLLSVGDLPVTLGNQIGGNLIPFERDFKGLFIPELVDSTPSVVETSDFSGQQSNATRTKETHRLMLSVSLLPGNFGDARMFGVNALSVQLRNNLGVNALSIVGVQAPIDANGNRISGINGFAQKYLGKTPNGLSFLELGTLEVPTGDLAGGTALSTARVLRPPTGRDPTKRYFHVVEHTRSLMGDSSLRSDTFALFAEVVVRVYTTPRPALTTSGQ